MIFALDIYCRHRDYAFVANRKSPVTDTLWRLLNIQSGLSHGGFSGPWLWLWLGICDSDTILCLSFLVSRFSVLVWVRSTHHDHTSGWSAVLYQPHESLLAGAELLPGLPVLPVAGPAAGLVRDQGEGRVDDHVSKECRLRQL